jgi:hypothetical protein
VLEQPATILITDLLGQTLYSEQASPGLSLIDTRGIPAGVYYIEIRRSDKRLLSKVIKQ